MPSETPSSPDRLRIALDAIARRRSVYRSAVVAAHERANAMLAAGGGAERAALELGQFAGSRIDASRFAALGTPSGTLDAASRAQVEEAAAVLESLAAADESAFVVDVPAGIRIGLAAGRALSELGCAFGAAATLELARAGRFDTGAHANLIDGLEFRRWGKTERAAAPPLVLRVNGQDAHAGALSEFLDGSVHLVLVIDGPCAPAALVRLITPGTLVLQTADTTGVDAFSKFDGPAVMALVPSSAACFIHDPHGGRSPWQRLRVWNRPASLPRKTIGGLSAAQQTEELLQLDALAERPSLESAAVESLVPAGAGDPTDRLASWLLDASGLNGQ